MKSCVIVEWCFVHVSDTHEQGWVPQSILKPLFPVKKDCNTVISPATTSSSSCKYHKFQDNFIILQ